MLLIVQALSHLYCFCSSLLQMDIRVESGNESCASSTLDQELDEASRSDGLESPTLEEGVCDADVPDLAASDSAAVDTAAGGDDHLSVMLVSCQDLLLVRTYQGPPPLPYVLPLVSHSSLIFGTNHKCFFLAPLKAFM